MESMSVHMSVCDLISPPKSFDFLLIRPETLLLKRERAVIIQRSEFVAGMEKPTYTVSYGKSSLGRPRGLVNDIKINRTGMNYKFWS
jgi:hypothetical protein